MDNFDDITVLEIWDYASGLEAREQERQILKTFKANLYQGPDVLAGGGNSEIFDIDVLGLDPDAK